MTKLNKKIILLIVGVVGLISLVLLGSLKDRSLTAGLNIEAVPAGLSLSINGKTAKQGINKVAPGNYKVTGSLNGFADQSVTMSVSKGETRFVGLILAPNSAATASWYADHPDDQQVSQDIASKSSDQAAQIALQNLPLIKYLPFIDLHYRIDYGKSQARPNDASAVAIYITTDKSATARGDALAWIKYKGTDPSKLEIIYKTF